MTPEELQRTLSVSGVTCRVKGEEVLVETCPYCGNSRWNMEINVVRGVAKCWSCGEPRPGRADTVVNLLTGETHRIGIQERDGPSAAQQSGPPLPFAMKRAFDFQSSATYLGRRGIHAAIARKYELSVCTEAGHLLEGRIVIPAKDYWSGELVGWVGRSYTGRKPKYLSTLQSPVPITGWRQHAEKVCVVVEGHFDGIGAHMAGYSAAVLGSTHNPLFDAWAARLDPDVLTVVMLDGAAMAEAGALYWKLSAIRGVGSSRYVAMGANEDPGALSLEEVRKRVDAVL